MSDEETRPVHRVFDFSSGEETETPVTDEEWDELKQRALQSQEEERKKQQEDEELRRAVENHPDPVVQALAKKAGII